MMSDTIYIKILLHYGEIKDSLLMSRMSLVLTMFIHLFKTSMKILKRIIGVLLAFIMFALLLLPIFA